MAMTTAVLIVGPRCYHWWDKRLEGGSELHEEGLIRDA